MKLSPTPARHQAGSALLLTVVLVGLVGFLIIAYLGLVQNQNFVTVRSQAWNAAIPVLEAGIEDALVHLNLHGATNLACDGWTQSGNTYTMQRDLGENFYSVSITNWVSGASNNAPIIESKGYVVAPLLTAAPAPGFLAAVASPNPTVAYFGRGVRVRTAQGFIFTKGMVARDTIDLNGNNIRTDSFDSIDPLYSTNGLYTGSKIKANGDIASNSSITNSISVGNADIYGHVSTGPNGTVSVGSQGSVGDLAWHTNGTKGIQPGYGKSDMNVSFFDVAPPFSGGYVTPGGGWITNTTTALTTNTGVTTSIPYPSGAASVTTNYPVSSATYPSGSPGPVTTTITTNWNGGHNHITGYTTNYAYPTFTATTTTTTTNTTSAATYYDFILDQNVNYQIGTLNGSVYVNAKAVLYVTTSLNISSMTINSGKTLNLYASVPSVSLSGNNSANSDGTADSFSFWGLPACTSITFSGNAGFTGSIYAPNANLTLNGGGNNTTDFIGASVTRTVRMNGHFNFHYDEALGKIGPSRGFVVTSWNEMLPSEVPRIAATR